MKIGISSLGINRRGDEMIVEAIGSNQSADAASPGGQTVHLSYLDSLRALAALYVALFHIGMWRRFQRFDIEFLNWLPLSYGHYAVDVFIVLSGFCLTISVARRRGSLQPWKEYITRRAKRILPPYYAAIVVSLLVLGFREAADFGSRGDYLTLPVTPANLAAHLLLIHNWSNQWIFKINGPLWSIAVEWQLYFFYPILAVWIYRKGTMLVAIPAVLAGSLLHFLPGHPLDATVPWFLGLFAFGIGGAIVALDPGEKWKSIRDRFPWGLLTAMASAGIFAALLFAWWARDRFPSFGDDPRFMTDPMVGIATAFLLIWLANAKTKSIGGLLRSALSWKPLVGMGLFSYSFYLIHGPLVDLAGRIVQPYISSPSRDALFGALLLCLPLIVGLAYLFHRQFELPFMRPSAAKRDARPPISAAERVK